MKNNSEKRIKVLFLASWYPNEEEPMAGIFIKRHAEAVSEFCKVALLYIHHSNYREKTSFEISDISGVRTYQLYFKVPPFKNRYLKSVYRMIFQNLLFFGFIKYRKIKRDFGKPDIIHANVLFPMGKLGLLLNFVYDIPFVITEHLGPFNLHINNFLDSVIGKIILRKAKSVILDSKSQVKEVEIFLKRDYTVIPCVIDTKKFTPNSTIKKPNHKTRIIHISLLKERKRIRGIIDAVFALSKNRTDFELHIIGNALNRPDLEEYAKKLNLLNQFVFFHGHVDDENLLELLKASDFFVLNSEHENFSVVCAEAIACGIPVISTRCGGPEDFVTENVGILISKENPDELVQAMNYLIDNSSKYDPQILHEHILNQFRNDIVGKKIYEIYSTFVTEWSAGYSNKRLRIEKEWLVCDIGSGHNPHPRADILIDRDTDYSPHRSGKKSVIPRGRDLIIADVQLGLPLKDKVFDYSISSHVAEHVDDPKLYCREISRIAKRGYIETPGKLSDFLLDDLYHKWRVFQRDSYLVFEEKADHKLLSRSFYQIFYYGEINYSHKTIKFSNKWIHSFFLRISHLLRKIWPHLPYTYTCYEWENEINCQLIN
jgi:glycosyltransferase involved in cell wall biosynthesis